MVRDAHGRPLFLQGVAFDITDRKNAEETLRRANDELEQQVAERTVELAASLGEKEDLLKEVHHRVKNNLQLISTMLRSQARALNDPKVTPFFTAMQDRLKSIADVHEHLGAVGDPGLQRRGKRVAEILAVGRASGEEAGVARA